MLSASIVHLEARPVTGPVTGLLLETSAATGTTLAYGSEIAMGVPMNASGLNKVVRRVIVLASGVASIYVCTFIGNLLTGAYSSESPGNEDSLWTGLSSLILELSIPVCGYYGALHTNRQLACCFCGCNLFLTILSAMSFIRINIRISEINGQCEREQSAQQRKTCETWTGNSLERGFMVSSTILMIFLGCLAFWFGNSLYQQLAQEVPGHSFPRLIGELVAISDLPVDANSAVIRPNLGSSNASTSDGGLPAIATGTTSSASESRIPYALESRSEVPASAGENEEETGDAVVADPAPLLHVPPPATTPRQEVSEDTQSRAFDASNTAFGAEAEPSTPQRCVTANS